jgi:hypothetical protein
LSLSSSAETTTTTTTTTTGGCGDLLTFKDGDK